MWAIDAFAKEHHLHACYATRQNAADINAGVISVFKVSEVIAIGYVYLWRWPSLGCNCGSAVLVRDRYKVGL
jgi:hypothetical protein